MVAMRKHAAGVKHPAKSLNEYRLRLGPLTIRLERLILRCWMAGTIASKSSFVAYAQSLRRGRDQECDVKFSSTERVLISSVVEARPTRTSESFSTFTLSARPSDVTMTMLRFSGLPSWSEEPLSRLHPCSQST